MNINEVPEIIRDNNPLPSPSYEEKMAHIALQRLFQAIPKGFDPHCMGKITITKIKDRNGLGMVASAPMTIYIHSHILPGEVQL